MPYQQDVFKRCHSDKHFSEFYLQDDGKKTTGIDMEQNYATVTVCITGNSRRGTDIHPT